MVLVWHHYDIFEMLGLLPQIGDWGRKGNANQNRAAEMMGQVGSCMPPDFVISTGELVFSEVSIVMVSDLGNYILSNKRCRRVGGS